jgi:hypothetical protein
MSTSRHRNAGVGIAQINFDVDVNDWMHTDMIPERLVGQCNGMMAENGLPIIKIPTLARAAPLAVTTRGPK